MKVELKLVNNGVEITTRHGSKVYTEAELRAKIADLNEWVIPPAFVSTYQDALIMILNAKLDKLDT